MQSPTSLRCQGTWLQVPHFGPILKLAPLPQRNKHYRKSGFWQQTGYFFGSEFAAGAAWFVMN
jgi:hypothetical protein